MDRTIREWWQRETSKQLAVVEADIERRRNDERLQQAFIDTDLPVDARKVLPLLMDTVVISRAPGFQKHSIGMLKNTAKILKLPFSEVEREIARRVALFSDDGGSNA